MSDQSHVILGKYGSNVSMSPQNAKITDRMCQTIPWDYKEVTVLALCPKKLRSAYTRIRKEDFLVDSFYYSGTLEFDKFPNA